jgi:hypothetical protein
MLARPEVPSWQQYHFAGSLTMVFASGALDVHSRLLGQVVFQLSGWGSQGFSLIDAGEGLAGFVFPIGPNGLLGRVSD